MTTIEQLPELDDVHTDEDLPIGHLPDDESMRALTRGERPTRALCGAELLGIKVDVPHRKCEECNEIMSERLGWTPN